ncbi:predicted protein, partial [Thalassiosira pseudonana CCMP1335]
MSVSTKKSTTPAIRQTVPSFHRSHQSKKSDIRKLRRLSAPHVEGFNYFLDVGLSRGVADIVPYEIDLVDTSIEANRGIGHEVGKPSETIQFWLENVRVGMPTKST